VQTNTIVFKQGLPCTRITMQTCKTSQTTKLINVKHKCTCRIQVDWNIVARVRFLSIMCIKHLFMLKNVLNSFSNLSTKFVSSSITFTMLFISLQSNMGSLGQFLWTKINHSILSISNLYQCKFVKIPKKEKMHFVLMYDLLILNIYLASNPSIGNIGWCFIH
jgi:hypothetical protein